MGQALSSLTERVFDDEPLSAAVGRVTPERFDATVNELLNTALVRIYLFGNYDEAYAEALASAVRAALPADRDIAPQYVRERVYAPIAGQSLVRNMDVPVEDLGMMLLYAAPEATVENEALAVCWPATCATVPSIRCAPKSNWATPQAGSRPCCRIIP